MWENEPLISYVLPKAGPRAARHTLCFWLFLQQPSPSPRVIGICMVKFPQVTRSVTLEASRVPTEGQVRFDLRVPGSPRTAGGAE